MIEKFRLMEQNQKITGFHVQAAVWRTIYNVGNKASSTTKGKNGVGAGLHRRWKKVRRPDRAVRKAEDEGST